MNKRFEKLAFAAVGSALVAKKKVDSFVDELVSTNSLSEKEGEAFVKMLLRKAREEEKKFDKLFAFKEKKATKTASTTKASNEKSKKKVVRSVVKNSAISRVKVKRGKNVKSKSKRGRR